MATRSDRITASLRERVTKLRCDGITPSRRQAVIG
jgi:hypothetical protein